MLCLRLRFEPSPIWALFGAAALLGGCGVVGPLLGGAGGEGPGDADLAEAEPHCGAIDADQTWGPAGSAHRITCNVNVKQGTLTIAPGVKVIVDEGRSLTVGKGDDPARLLVMGEPDRPVTFRTARPGDPPGAWSGVELGPSARGSEVHNLVLEKGGTERRGALLASELAVLIDGLQVREAGGCGVELRGEAVFTEDSVGIKVQEGGGPPVCLPIAAVPSLPLSGSDYAGNAVDHIQVDGAKLEVSATWKALGVPYLLLDTLSVSGSASAPAVLRLRSGVELRFSAGKGLRLSADGGASGLITEGTEEEPVVLGPAASETPGAWDGVEVMQGVLAGDLDLQHTRIAYGGDNGEAGLRVRDAELRFQGLEIHGSSTAGLMLEGDASLGAEASGLHLHDNARPLELPPELIGALPPGEVLIEDNVEDVIYLVSPGLVTRSALWPALGDGYRVRTDIQLEGTNRDPALIEVEAGVALRFDENRGVAVSKAGGSAGLTLAGTERDPVLLVPYAGTAPGTWRGVELYGDLVAEETRLSHFVLESAGGRGADGAITVKEARPVISNGTIRYIDEDACGIFLREADITPNNMRFEDTPGGEICTPSR